MSNDLTPKHPAVEAAKAAALIATHARGLLPIMFIAQHFDDVRAAVRTAIYARSLAGDRFYQVVERVAEHGEHGIKLLPGESEVDSEADVALIVTIKPEVTLGHDMFHPVAYSLGQLIEETPSLQFYSTLVIYIIESPGAATN